MAEARPARWFLGGLALLLPGALAWAASPASSSLPSGEALMRAVDERPEGNEVDWDLEFTLVDRHGSKRVRTARLLRKKYKQEGRRQERQVAVFLSPANVRQVGLLTFDNKGEAADDDIWLYLPALKKLRRIPASDRGDNFVGTDLTYEDIKGGFAYRDYEYQVTGRSTWQENGVSHDAWAIEARPRTKELQQALGFARTEMLVLDDLKLRVEQKFYDAEGHLDRTMSVHDVKQVDGVWTWLRLEVENHETQHRTILVVRQAKYDRGLADDLFTERSLLSESIR